ncbi:MAG: hypothetical protein ACRYGC_08500 [Janthinobacterium lividum]
MSCYLRLIPQRVTPIDVPKYCNGLSSTRIRNRYFVGCPAEGMSGPVAAPTGAALSSGLSASVAGKLAHYAAEGTDVLAPRGWYCIEMYGSSGAFLLVTPEPHGADELQDFRPLSGRVVELPYLNGWASGRFDVARVLARLFPPRHAFVRQVIREGMDPARNFPFGPYPADRLIRHGSSEFEFIKPPGRACTGTVMDRLDPGGMPVGGLARLAMQDGVTLLDVRLPAGSRPLTAAIIRFSRRR